jgi:hypothetical protein
MNEIGLICAGSVCFLPTPQHWPLKQAFSGGTIENNATECQTPTPLYLLFVLVLVLVLVQRNQ